MRMLAVVLVTALVACGSDLKVESDTSWDGFIGGAGGAGASVEGSGNHTFELNPGITCWNFQKQTQAGRLRAYVEKKTIFGSDEVGDATTTAQYGIVSGCTE